MMPQNPSWLEGFVGITVGLGAREAAGRQVGELVAPSGPNVLIATTEDGVKVAPGLGYTDDMVGGNLVREDYEPILPTETIQRFWDDERIEQLGFGVWAVRADEPEERLVLHRDFTGSHILIVPRSLSPIGGDE
jgi:alkylation response protein AidB-like acyl-CoA dehydrogenase